MTLLLLLALGSIAVMAEECVYVPEIRQAKVDVAAFDFTGADIRPLEVQFFQPANCATKVETPNSGGRMLYGEYLVRVSAPGFRPAWRHLVVDQDEVSIRVPLELGYRGCPSPPASIGGTVVRGRFTGEFWVKVVPLRGTGGGESRVSSAGFFLVSGLQHGAYLLLLMRDDDVLHSKVIRTVSTETSKLVIDLRAKR
jgi:hypothetical protein